MAVQSQSSNGSVTACSWNCSRPARKGKKRHRPGQTQRPTRAVSLSCDAEGPSRWWKEEHVEQKRSSKTPESTTENPDRAESRQRTKYYRRTECLTRRCLRSLPQDEEFPL